MGDTKKPEPELDACPITFTGEVVESGGRSYTTPSQNEFLEFRTMADAVDGFKLRYEKNNVWVWDQPPERGTSNFNRIKVFAAFDNIPPSVLYDVLHDPEYRSVWDENMIEGYRIAQLTPTCDIGYYAVKMPMTISNRDVCNMRMWTVVDNNEYIIFNTSMPHRDCPEKRGFVRVWSIVSGYLVRPYKGGCSLTYLTQSNPKGWLPSYIVNGITSKLTPAMMAKIGNAAAKYPEWKLSSTKRDKPWLTPESRRGPWPSGTKDVTHAFIDDRFNRGELASPVQPPTPQTPPPEGEGFEGDAEPAPQA